MNQWIKKIGNITNNFKNKQKKHQLCQLWLILITLYVNFANLIRNKKKLMIYSEFVNLMTLPKLLIKTATLIVHSFSIKIQILLKKRNVTKHQKTMIIFVHRIALLDNIEMKLKKIVQVLL